MIDINKNIVIQDWLNSKVISQEDLANKKKIVMEADKIVKKLNNLYSNQLGQKIKSAFLLYGYAIDNYYNCWTSCLFFWELIEILSLFEYKNDYDNVAKRITSIMKKNKKICSDIIEIMRIKRNDFMHHGNLKAFSYNDINMIKGVIELFLHHLAYNIDRYENTQGLSIFFENANLPDRELEQKIKIIIIIQRDRKSP